ncbi:hypothetical protein A4A49_63424, partial [Nicotiana attenuata]
YTNILADCRYLLDQLHSATIAHTYREGNEVADGLAKAGCDMASNDKPFIFEEPPDFVRTFLQRDREGSTRFRKTTCTLQEQEEDMDHHTFAIHHTTQQMDASNGDNVMDNYVRIANSNTCNRQLLNNYISDAHASPSL